MNKFSMGNAFNEGKAFVMQRPALYIGLVLLAQILAMAVMFGPIGGAAGMAALGNPADPMAAEQLMAGFGGLFFLAIFLGIALQFMGYYAVWRHGLANGSVSVGEAIIYGLKACVPALVFAIVAYIAIVVAVIPVAAIAGVAQSPAIAVILGIAAFVGFIYLLGRFSIMGPEMAAENSVNPFSAAGRSWRATQGNGWMIALFFIIVYIVFFVLYFLAMLVITPITASMSGAAAFIVAMLLMIPLMIVGIFLGVGLPAGVYRDLVGFKNKSDIFS